MRRRRRLDGPPALLLAVSLLAASLLAGHAVAIAEDALVARWDFGTEETSSLVVHGNVKRDQEGPIAPEFPDFSPDNTAVYLNGKGAFFALPDPGANSPFDFGNGDAITMEAWVNVDRIGNGQNMYIIGKGRTGSPNFPKRNQNWSMRLKGAREGKAHLSAIFATTADNGDYQFHRWTSKGAFHVQTGWHHVAIEYRYGDPESMRGWIDGAPTDGIWDRGGKTTRPPVQDDDEIWIGSSLGGNPSNSFRGYLDAVAVHRKIFDPKVMKARFNRLGGPRTIEPLPEVMPEIDVPRDAVLLTLHEDLPSHTRWLNEGERWPEETVRWTSGEFLLPRIPVRFDDWGIRDAWDAPMLLRMAADVPLPTGEHRLLLRARGLSRLWVNGEVVARTEPQPRLQSNGQHPLTPLATPPHPGLRVHGHRMQEVTGQVAIPASTGQAPTARVLLEVVVGGDDLRIQSGEICVAVETADGASYDVLRPDGPPLPLTDAAVEPVLAEMEAALLEFDDASRRTAAASRAPFWDRRHDAARAWVAENPAPEPPLRGTPATAHPVDAFVVDKIRRARAAATGQNAAVARQFHDDVLPILREGCFRCHGDKAKGGLRLDSREALLKAGDSEIPAVVPGDTEASGLLTRVSSEDADLRMPPKGDGLSAAAIETLRAWIASGAPWPAPPDNATGAELAPDVGDTAFLRRVYLDTVGVPPTAGEIRAFLDDNSPQKRFTWIRRLLADDRFAGNWMGEWLDMLAENPTLANPALNSTGPFRWFLYDALRDNKPVDRMVTELILMRGDPDRGGSAGFAEAAENDAPMAAKGHVLASAFLGVEMQCARCHDAPYHSATQRDLFSLAAMLSRKAVAAPKSSTVPAEFFETMDRKPLIKVTLKPGEAVAPEWPFQEFVRAEDVAVLEKLMQEPDDARERLAAYMTAPQNERFAKVMVNRIWARLMGAGLVEPVHDWEGHAPSHPALLTWLARELVANGYDMRHIFWLILTSDTYQRVAAGQNREAGPDQRFFNAPDRRRMLAEQVVDSLHAATGNPMDAGRLTFVHDGRRPVSHRQDLGRPTRGWMFASLSNERDRPTLNLPRAQSVVDVLQAFGWTGARQKPITHRETEPNLLQPGILANGTLSLTLTRAADGSTLAQRAVDATSPGQLVEDTFLNFLGRMPSAAEREAFRAVIEPGFEGRLFGAEEIEPPAARPRLRLITWFNNLNAEAVHVQAERVRRVRQGPPPDRRLRPDWRARYEDMVWSLVNHREFIWIP